MLVWLMKARRLVEHCLRFARVELSVELGQAPELEDQALGVGKQALVGKQVLEAEEWAWERAPELEEHVLEAEEWAWKALEGQALVVWKSVLEAGETEDWGRAAFRLLWSCEVV